MTLVVRPLYGSLLPAYRVTGGNLPPRGVTVVRRGETWAATWSAHPGPRGTRHAFARTLLGALDEISCVEVRA